MSTKLAARMVRIFQSAGHAWPGGEENAVIHRTRAGRHQKSAGAWLWLLKPIREVEGALTPDVGSQTPASELREGETEVSSDFPNSYHLDPK